MCWGEVSWRQWTVLEAEGCGQAGGGWVPLVFMRFGDWKMMQQAAVGTWGWCCCCGNNELDAKAFRAPCGAITESFSTV